MTAKEFWKKQFDEYPQNDSEKLAVTMMQEYRQHEQPSTDKDKEMLGLVQDIERIGNESLIFEMDLRDAKKEIERLKGLIDDAFYYSPIGETPKERLKNLEKFKTENNL